MDDPTKILDKLPEGQRAAAFDAIKQASDHTSLKAVLDPLPLSTEDKAALWNLRAGGTTEKQEALQKMFAEPPSAARRFASSAYHQVDPIAAVQGLYEMFTSPVKTAGMIGTNSAMKGVEAYQAGKEGRVGDAVTSAIGAVPFIGPPVETAIQQAREGDYAGSLGTAVGAAIPFTRPLRTAKAGVTATARAVAPRAAEKVASRVEKIGAAKTVEAMAPTVGQNKTRIGNDAAKVAPELMERGLTNVWSREGLHDNVKVGLDNAGKMLDDAADARPSWKDFETSDVIAALEAKKAEIQSEAIVASKWPRRIDPETKQPVTEPYGRTQTPAPIQQRIRMIDSAITQLKHLGPSVRYEALRRLRAGYDVEAKAKYSGAVTPEYIKNVSRQEGAADVTGALREYLADKDPVTAAANGEYHLFKSADKILRATEEVERVRPKVGRKIMSRVAGSIAGSQIAGLAGAMIGYAAAPAAEVSIGMGMTSKLKMATQAQRLADAIRGQNAGAVSFYYHQLRRSLAQAGVQVEHLKEKDQRPYDSPIARAESGPSLTSPTAPPKPETPQADIPSTLQGAKPGTYTLKNGTVWKVDAAGGVTQLK